MKTKLVLLLIVAALLALAYVAAALYYDGRCIDAGGDGSKFTPQGVKCGISFMHEGEPHTFYWLLWEMEAGLTAP